MDLVAVSFQINLISWIIFPDILCNITVNEITEGIYVGDNLDEIFSKYISAVQ